MDTTSWWKALTVQQPWAECIARGVKLVENRSRPVSYRGPLAIHAGRTWSTRGGHHAGVIRTLAGLNARVPITKVRAGRRLGLTFGAVIAVVDLVDCHPDAGCCRPWGEEGTYHLVLENARRLVQPVRSRGFLGMWEVALPAVLGIVEGEC